MVFMFLFPDFPDFERFLYDKSRQTSDFFEETPLKIPRFARLDPKIILFGWYAYLLYYVY